MSVPKWLQRVRAGEPFEMVDMEFIQATFAAQAKLRAYSAAAQADFEAMQAGLEELFGKVGKSVVVLPPVMVDVGFNIEIGDDSFINTNSTCSTPTPSRSAPASRSDPIAHCTQWGTRSRHRTASSGMRLASASAASRQGRPS